MLDRKVPRYLSYPTAAQFHEGIGAAQFDLWTEGLTPGSRVDLYVHIPFCPELCWFCACRTQGAPSARAVGGYLDALHREIELVGARMPAGVTVASIHWGGGSPTILQPAQIEALAARLRSALPVEPGTAFRVEVDPRHLQPAGADALAKAGMTGALLGVLDFAPEVQQAVGRRQSVAQTEAAVAMLRSRGVGSVGVELVYGLPHQSIRSLSETLACVLALAPDRIAAFGYAHVPWMAKRQRMIEDRHLPGLAARLALHEAAFGAILAGGYLPVGIDHFARPGDPLARAAASGGLRRGFCGYSAGSGDALIGLGVSSISRFPQGFVQNTLQTGVYRSRLAEGRSASRRGIALGLEDRVRARAIEMLMCDFRLDLDALRAQFGDFARLLERGIALAADRFGSAVRRRGGGLEIVADGPLLARLVAQTFDVYPASPARLVLAV
ncbi:MAG: coproporphyrinogen dehydrogenase [Rhodobacteraceae bacterium]|uniref:radical SAM protein n=1 Tax=Amaricoccus sp. TaxID=1872485 RepID=UPI001D4C37EF|nr:radical SAM protein [Amaricoccus sp.]MCB1372195.1 coproporphyrinogen dehydrogenase [Paracoccaceae bacterium]MCC0066802.1 coproporphyrinogen dehydrogenase [Rhodovulum sp.]MCB1373921.1 coproporphyrinogen dehydrogenase [Paracoccaceae bacterium]MCB1403194.1 coproporphyrinogen dehydrogenase [Paracoccaceae bacterium]HRW15492.1 radical SAM protein [Amaricoccus sp.]